MGKQNGEQKIQGKKGPVGVRVINSGRKIWLFVWAHFRPNAWKDKAISPSAGICALYGHRIDDLVLLTLLALLRLEGSAGWYDFRRVFGTRQWPSPKQRWRTNKADALGREGGPWCETGVQKQPPNNFPLKLIMSAWQIMLFIAHPSADRDAPLRRLRIPGVCRKLSKILCTRFLRTKHKRGQIVLMAMGRCEGQKPFLVLGCCGDDRDGQKFYCYLRWQ